MWLQDLLPQAMPNVRIMTYGYKASFRNFTADQDIRSIATKLLSELVDVRPKESVSILRSNIRKLRLRATFALTCPLGYAKAYYLYMSQSRGHHS